MTVKGDKPRSHLTLSQRFCRHKWDWFAEHKILGSSVLGVCTKCGAYNNFNWGIGTRAITSRVKMSDYNWRKFNE